MLYKIITPNPTFSGERAGVVFMAGIAYTADARVAEELRRMGYRVIALGSATAARPSAPRRRKAQQETA